MIATATCRLSAIPMRKEPSDRSEMVNQMLFGECCSIIDQNEKWYLVELHHDRYQGWVDKKQITMSDGPPALSVVNVPLWTANSKNGSTLLLPAGAFYEKEEFLASPPPTPINIASLALSFLGAPYLWGGKTVLGMDCSGFTQVVFRLLGHSLPRDAYQQAEAGVLVSFLDEAVTGDLAFFDNSDGRIVHVGIILNDHTNGSFTSIVHASGEVRVDPLDSQGILLVKAEKYSHQLRTIRRII